MVWFYPSVSRGFNCHDYLESAFEEAPIRYEDRHLAKSVGAAYGC